MQLVEIEVQSEALRENPLGDSSRRILPVIVPEDIRLDEPIPCIWWLAGYAGTGRQMLADDPWQEGLIQRLRRLRQEGLIGKLAVALPDAFTRYGGCQYLSSLAVGDYETYLWRELPMALAPHVRVSQHGVAGKSSGGFGAIHAALRQPQLFKAVACHSGDMGFELSVFPDLPKLIDAVHRYGSLETLLDVHAKSLNRKEGRWFGPLSMIALSSVYSPDASESLGIALPFEPTTGRLRPEILNRWLAFDPPYLLERSAQAREVIAGLSLFYFDCGSRDEHALHWGARQLADVLRRYKVPFEHEEFDGGHRQTSYRLDVSLPKLYAALRS